MPGQVDLVRVSGSARVRLEIRAGRVMELARPEALRLARVRAEIAVESEEPDERVVILIETQTASQRQLGQDVIGDFGKRCGVLVHALLIGQPDGIRPAGDPIHTRKIGDHVVLQNPVLLPLIKEPCDETQALIGW